MDTLKGITSKNRWLALVFGFLLLVSFGTVVPNALAMGQSPGICPNRYDGPIPSATLTVGNQTYDPIANPGLTITVNSTGVYGLTLVIHTANESSQGNTNNGTTWFDTDLNGFSFGECVYSTSHICDPTLGCVPEIGPNQNAYIDGNFTDRRAGTAWTQHVDFDGWVNGGPVAGASYNVDWVCPCYPSNPQNLQAVAGNGHITLSWSPSSNGGSAITNYNVYRGTSSGAESFFAKIANVTSYNDTTVTNGQTYYYYVTATNSVGTSLSSNEASAMPIGPPSPPTGLTATAKLLKINLSWTAPSDNGGTPITGYMIERSTDSGNTWSTLVANTGSTGTTYSDTNVQPLTTYTYRVSAINDVGTSDPSNMASASIASMPTLP